MDFAFGFAAPSAALVQRMIEEVVPPAPELVTFADDFAGGAANADLSARQGWTKEDGNRAAQTTGTNSVKHVGTGTQDAGYTVDLETPKHFVECAWMSTNNSTTFGLAGRMLNGSNYVAIRRNANQWQLFKNVNGGFTQLGSSPKEIVLGDIIRMEFDGDFVTCYRNGENFIGLEPTQLNAPTLANATKAGTAVRASVAPLISNFRAGGLA